LAAEISACVQQELDAAGAALDKQMATAAAPSAAREIFVMTPIPRSYDGDPPTIRRISPKLADLFKM